VPHARFERRDKVNAKRFPHFGMQQRIPGSVGLARGVQSHESAAGSFLRTRFRQSRKPSTKRDIQYDPDAGTREEPEQKLIPVRREGILFKLTTAYRISHGIRFRAENNRIGPAVSQIGDQIPPCRDQVGWLAVGSSPPAKSIERAAPRELKGEPALGLRTTRIEHDRRWVARQLAELDRGHTHRRAVRSIGE
jgi:hypothetical protein